MVDGTEDGLDVRERHVGLRSKELSDVHHHRHALSLQFIRKALRGGIGFFPTFR